MEKHLTIEPINVNFCLAHVFSPSSQAVDSCLGTRHAGRMDVVRLRDVDENWLCDFRRRGCSVFFALSEVVGIFGFSRFCIGIRKIAAKVSAIFTGELCDSGGVGVYQRAALCADGSHGNELSLTTGVAMALAWALVLDSYAELPDERPRVRD